MANDYLTSLQAKREYKNNTLALKKIGLKKMILQGINANNKPVIELVNHIYKSNVKDFKVSYSLREDKYLKRHEIELLIDKTTKRMSLIIKFLFYTGLRISEAINIKYSDIEVNDFVNIRIIGKGNKERFIKIPVNLFNEIKDFYNSKIYLFETLGHKQYSKQNIYKELQRQSKKILNKKVNPHMFRHSLADYLINVRKIGLPSVSKMLGHSSSKITADIYCHSTPAFTDLYSTNGELL
jgi:integrase/recombinase XerD